LSRLCDAVLSWYGAPNTNEGGRTMRDAVADIKSILGPMGLTDRRAAEAQIRQVCPRNPTPILDQIPFAVPPTAEQTTTAYTPFSTRETPPPPPPEAYKPVQSVDRVIREEYEEPAESLGPEGLTYPPPPIMGPPGNPIPPPMIPTGPTTPSGPVKCWYTPGQGYSWGPPPSGAQPTDIQKQSDCENLVRTQGEIRGFAVQPPQVPAQAQVTDQSTGMTATQAASGMQPPAPVATGIPCDPMRGQFIDPVTRQCRGSVATGGGYGGVAFGGGGGMTIPGGLEAGGGMTAATAFMGARFPVMNIRRR